MLGFCGRAEPAVEHEGDGDTNCIWDTWNGSQELEMETGRNENLAKNGDHPDRSTLKIS